MIVVAHVGGVPVEEFLPALLLGSGGVAAMIRSKMNRSLVRHACFGLTLVACALLVAGEFGDLNQIRIGGVIRDGQGVGDNDSYALLIVAVVAAVMAFGAWRTGSRPAAIAVA